jgi:nickel/cobalt transporter (NicO) family protein
LTDVSLQILLGTAATIAVVHTLIGIDHSLPFVAIGRARGWTLRKTLVVTAACGGAHVLSSVLLGMLGIAMGIAAGKLEFLQELRGQFAAWMLIGFGLAYMVYAGVKLWRGAVHSHVHVHEDGVVHDHGHSHEGAAHLHPHGEGSMTVWALFLIFAFGPCEALIPLLMAPAWGEHWLWVLGVISVFGALTVVTMMGAVAVGFIGLSLAGSRGLDRYANVLAGAAIAASGLAIQALGI